MRRLKSTRRTLLAVGLTLAAALPASALYMEFTGGAEPVSLQQAAEYGWPKGTLSLVNHKLRKQSWYGIWSGHPNDARSYVYRVENTEEANQLLAVLAEVDAPVRRVLLMPEPEFRSTLSRGLAGNATFTIGSQKMVDQYYGSVKKVRPDFKPVFGPSAPSLTLYAGDGRIQVSRLTIPKGVQAKVNLARPERIEPKLRAELEAFAAAHQKDGVKD